MELQIMPDDRPKTWTFHIVTLGCKVNQYESQALREAWQKLGGVEVASGAEAQVSVVNSCAITARAERETRNALYRLARENPQGQRILTGCSALLAGSAQHAKTPKETFAHAILSAKQKSLLLQGPWQVLQGKLPAPSVPPPYPPFRIAAFHRARPVLKVQDGCSHRCTYCIVPIARGPAVSRPPQEVLDEARRLLHAGYREIILSGINLSQYGRNSPTFPNSQNYGNFWQLLDLLQRELAPEWAGTARFRISSLEPGQLNARGIESLSRCTLLCPHLHISLQSGSYPVLRRMGRGHYKPQQLLDGIAALHKHWPRMGLGADILTGFPGESPEHHAETLQVIADLPLTYAHVFPYSPRPHTAAANFPDQVPHHEKLQRAAHIRAAVQKKQEAFLHSLLALNLTHLVLDGTKATKGINEFYAQCRLTGTEKKEISKGIGIIQVKPVRIEKKELVLVVVVEEIGALPQTPRGDAVPSTPARGLRPLDPRFGG